MHDVETVGGKNASLGEMIGSLANLGVRVPGGFATTAQAYRDFLKQGGLNERIRVELAALNVDDVSALAATGARIRGWIMSTPFPPELQRAVTDELRKMSNGKEISVAVRSSATAEDLPEASFAGQQETFLSVRGIDAVLSSVRRVFASLYNDRATQYRASLGIAPQSVRLAVVIQRMVDASTAGVLFTANPLTGKRRQAVIEANPGLGEAVVSGATNPDHFVVQTTTGEIIERRRGEKRAVIHGVAGGGTQRMDSGERSGEVCLSDAQICT